jgi:ankyrin repeat protein
MQQEQDRGFSLMIIATFRFVELLLSRGAQVDVRNKKGNSSLWLAANGGHLDVVQLLYSAGRPFFIPFFLFFLWLSQLF